MKNIINIQNKKIMFEYELLHEYTAGIQLLGTEIKSIRQNKANINESFCQIKDNNLYIINMYIAEYKFGTHYNHSPRREKKLLLKKSELLKLKHKIQGSNLTIIPKKLFINNKGYAKLQIFLSKQKKLQDKRHFIRIREINQEYSIEYKKKLKY